MAGTLDDGKYITMSSISLTGGIAGTGGSGATLVASVVSANSGVFAAGFTMAGVGNSALFEGPSRFTAGTAILPGIAFSSESSLGFFRSGNSVMALSYGHLRASISYSGNTASTSATTANQTVQGSFRVSVLSLTSNGAEIAVLSGNTTYKFASVAVA